jgi:hypothetical protein
MREKRFDYYDRLSSGQRRIYRASDAISAVVVPDAGSLRPLVQTLEGALADGRRVRVTRAANTLVDMLLNQLGAPAVVVRVRELRPKIHDGELHGLYTWAEKAKQPKIEVWMRTAAHGKVVRFRTFLRTLVHEIVHHLDFAVFGLGDSFHTQGFFRRESSLVRQLLSVPNAPQTKQAPAQRRPSSVQLSLFGKR